MQTSDLNGLLARANAGDAQAQYVLAATLARAGRRPEADKWLNAAANNGYAEAEYTLATQKLQSAAGANEAFALARGAASHGSHSAVRLLAVLYAEGLGAAPDWAAAIDLIAGAARDGDAHARLELGALLYFSGAAPLADAAALIADAATRDLSAAAVYARLCAETGGGEAARLGASLSSLHRAGYPNIAALSHACELSGAGGSGESERCDPDALCAQFSETARVKEITAAIERWTADAPEARPVSQAPRARFFRGAFPAAACEYVIAMSARRLAPSTTFDPRTGEVRLDAYRTSRTATLGVVDLDLPLLAIADRLAALAGAAHENGEFLSVLQYRPSEEYKPHFDWLPPGPDFDRGGQRVSTALLYLNDGYEGGETHFLTPDLSVRGAAGDVLAFDNASPDGAPDKTSRHASLPVTRGEKWLASRWFRERKYNF